MRSCGEEEEGYKKCNAVQQEKGDSFSAYGHGLPLGACERVWAEAHLLQVLSARLIRIERKKNRTTLTQLLQCYPLLPFNDYCIYLLEIPASFLLL